MKSSARSVACGMLGNAIRKVAMIYMEDGEKGPSTMCVH